MTSLQVYESFLTKANRNDSNANINVPRGKFILIYNEKAKSWFQQKLRKKSGTNEIDELHTLLVDNVDLKKNKDHIDHSDFILPEDFFDISHSFIIASKDSCERTLENWPVKDKNIRTLLKNSNYKPSFDYEETLCVASDNNLKVYFDDFKIKKVYLSYYREPRDIDIEGYTKLDGTPSTNIDPDLPDFAVNQIINRCVLEFHGISENRDGFEVSKNRVNTEE